VPPRHDAFLSQHDGRSLLALSSLVGLTGADPESRTQWIHVAPFGVWKGHSEGEFELTRESFASVCAQLAGKRTPVSLDYEHASIRPNGQPTPAAGYALAGEIRGDGSSPEDGLYARIEFTKRAADFIHAGEYKFCSGVFCFDAPDAQTGDLVPCALDTIALTNRPFIDGQKPIALSRRLPLSNGASMPEVDPKVLQKALDALPGPNTADKYKMVLDLLVKGASPTAPADAPAKDAAKADASRALPLTASEVTAPAPAVALAGAPPPPAPMPMTDPAALADTAAGDPTDPDNDAAVDDVDAKLMAATGLDIDGLAAALLANFDAVVAALMGTSDPSATALSREIVIKGKDEQIVALTRERNELRTRENARIESDSAAEVDALIKRMPGLQTQRASMLKLARTSPAEFRSVAASLAPVGVDLTRSHATALGAPKPNSEALAVSSVPDDHPRLVAQRVSLSRTTLPEDVKKRVMDKVREEIAHGGN